MLQTSNYSMVLSLQFLLLSYDLFVNSFSELLRMAPVIQLVLFIIQDIAILFNIIIIFLMFFNTFVFQAGLVNLLFHKFKGTIILTSVYLALSISLHVWVMNVRWKNPSSFTWTNGLQTLFVFQRLGLAVAAQGVHASPKVTTSGHVDEYLSFLGEGAWTALQGGAAIGPRKQDTLTLAVLSIQKGRLTRHGWKQRKGSYCGLRPPKAYLVSSRLAGRGGPYLKKQTNKN
ncbi:transmembrane protein 138 isoform X1 [Apodemus sylvaticus]|uniref:transmembrane protein 138 isoform X1 n=1 Tax=Apodemus sylvaticus TaxID=10129 RepID=UPI0022422D99|nr:transmembrane protein 138 isoform X1 [Apodemus sylvaticus]XP_052045903.1 transmembrane protein 138 isoform X1 [Apodemus sylvaticus]XP_052045912.1 transmembrane protein 138 isoform X1 [Apodemus sylvaticus]XP_052045920.1 transmembrane protein 138 isoform X1 [Apodemus sylvaticus]